MRCFLGAHGTGKTTLINEVRKIKKNIFVTDAFSRPIHAASNLIGLTEWQMQILNFELMLWAQNNYYEQNVLTTRSLFDSIIFARLLTPDIEVLPKIEEHVKKNLHRVKKVFYLPIEFSLQKDGVRYDKEFQVAYDNEIKKLIQEFSIPHITLRGEIKDRLSQLLYHL